MEAIPAKYEQMLASLATELKRSGCLMRLTATESLMQKGWLLRPASSMYTHTLMAGCYVSQIFCQKQAKDLLEKSILSEPSLYKYADLQRQDILKTLGGKNTFSLLEDKEQNQDSPQSQALAAFKNENFEQAVAHLLVLNKKRKFLWF